MATTPLTTVLIDTYNYGRFIEQAIESVLSQDFPAEHLQVIVVDDGSTDDTTERVGKYGSRIKYLKKENGGQASAFNAGFAEARGEFIVLLDADDFFLPGKLRRVFGAFQQHPEAGMIYHKLPEMHRHNYMAPAPGFQDLSGFLPAERQKMASYEVHQTSCLAFRRSVLQELLPMPESMRIQADAYLELIAVLITSVLAIPEELAVYRIHGKNLCATDVMGASAEGRKRVIVSTGTVIDEVQNWIRLHPERVGGFNTRRLLDRVRLRSMERLFAFEPPERFRYFVFLLRRNYAFSPAQGWTFTALKYLASLAAPLLGYGRSRSLYAWFGNSVNLLRDRYARLQKGTQGAAEKR